MGAVGARGSESAGWLSDWQVKHRWSLKARPRTALTHYLSSPSLSLVHSRFLKGQCSFHPNYSTHASPVGAAVSAGQHHDDATQLGWARSVASSSRIWWPGASLGTATAWHYVLILRKVLISPIGHEMVFSQGDVLVSVTHNWEDGGGTRCQGRYASI